MNAQTFSTTYQSSMATAPVCSIAGKNCFGRMTSPSSLTQRIRASADFTLPVVASIFG